MVKVKDLMTKNIQTVTPQTSLVDAANILMQYKFDGLPVVAKNNKLMGLVTEYDCISKGSMIHIPTFIKIVQNIQLYKRDITPIKDELTKLLSLKVSEVMNSEPIVISPEASLADAVQLFSEHHRINPIPVIDAQGLLVGILSRSDILKLYMPASATHVVTTTSDTPALEHSLKEFLEKFHNRFVVVGKSRTRLWLLAGAMFLLLGFLLGIVYGSQVQLRLYFSS